MIETPKLERGAQRAGRYMSAHAAFAEGQEDAPAGLWGSLAKACLEELGTPPEGANLGFLYVTEVLAENLGSIATFLRERSGIEHWVGTVGAGIMANGTEIYDRPALSLMVAALPEDGFRVFTSIGADVDGSDFEDFAEAHAGWIARRRPILGVVHADPRNREIADIVEALADTTSAFLVGGLTAGESDFPQVAAAGGTPLCEGGLSGVLFSSDQMVVSGLSQGCTPIGPDHVVGEVEDPGIIKTLDDRPVLEVLREDIGELLARDLRRIGGYIFVSLPIPGSDTGDYLVRNLVGLDLERGLLQVGAEVEPGMRIGFCRRDHASARADLKRMLEDLRERAGGAPRGALYVSCIARGRHLFGPNSEELKLIRETFGDMPLTGFFANGEICNNRLYGYTGVLTLLL